MNIPEDLETKFKKRIIKLTELDNTSDEIQLECGHTIIRVCPTSKETNLCYECLEDWLDKWHRSFPEDKRGKR